MKTQRPSVNVTLALIISCLLLPACTTYVDMDTTTFFQKTMPQEGNIFIAAADHERNTSLEFKHYKPMIADKLQQQGYSVVEDAKQASLIAVVSYGIDNGRVTTKTQPVYGYSGAMMYGDRYGRYAMPSYSVVGVTTSESTEYKRAIALDIVDAKRIHTETPKKWYEGRVKSRGRCSTLTQVFPEMLAGLFNQFPGENGKTQSLQVEGEDCD